MPSTATSAPAIKPAKGAIGPLIDQLVAQRKKYQDLQKIADAAEGEFKEMSEALLLRLEADGMDKATGKAGTASVGESLTGNIDDWDELTKYVKRTGHFQLFQKRLSDPAVCELLEQKGKIPGVVPFTKKRLNLRAT